MKSRVLIGLVLSCLVLVGGAFGIYRLSARESTDAREAAFTRLAGLPPEERSALRGLAVVDYSRPGWHRRMALYDEDGDLVDTFLVAHARNSGGYVSAVSFSNEMDSNQSSLGLFRVTEVYEGDHGTALRLDGLDPGVNDRAFERDIVIHGADYVSFGSIVENLFAGKGPGVGRSLGCPAVSREAVPVVIEALGEGGYVFVYH